MILLYILYLFSETFFLFTSTVFILTSFFFFFILASLKQLTNSLPVSSWHWGQRICLFLHKLEIFYFIVCQLILAYILDTLKMMAEFCLNIPEKFDIFI